MNRAGQQYGAVSISVKLVASLWLAVVGSALGVVYVAHQSRLLYHELALLEQEKNRLEVDWGRYLLEESSLASMYRVETAAQKKLGLQVPGIEEIVVVKP